MNNENALEQIKFLITRVEGYERTNDPSDRGGDTQYGVTQGELVRHGMSHPITFEQACQWFYDHYWVTQNLDLINDRRLQWRLFCDGVHVGIHTASRFLQIILNASNRQGRRWFDIKTDGVIGPNTYEAYHSFLKNSPWSYEDTQLHLTQMIKAQTFTKYLDIIEQDDTQEKWFYGWTNRLTKDPEFYSFEKEFDYP